MVNKVNDRIDPDPFSVAAVLISGCALILQFVRTSKTLETPPSSPITDKANRSNILEYLRTYVDMVSVKLDRTIRAIERGSENSEQEFFEARFRLQQGQLFLDPAYYDQFMRALSETFGAIGNLSLWINHTVKNDPSLAVFLGKHINESVGDLASELNAIVESGKANRLILEGLRRSIDALIRAIDAAERMQN